MRAGGSFARIAFSSALARSARWADVSGAALDAAAFLGAASDVTGRAAGAARACMVQGGGIGASEVASSSTRGSVWAPGETASPLERTHRPKLPGAP
eukprot:scaffold106153_cov64-Phaeocystis_antarctica.AAC.4